MGSRGVAAGANPSLVSGRGQGTTWTSRQLIAGPSLMSNVGFSVSLKDTLCSSALPGAGIEPATFQSLVDLLYPLSYSRPVTVAVVIITGHAPLCLCLNFLSANIFIAPMWSSENIAWRLAWAFSGVGDNRPTYYCSMYGTWSKLLFCRASYCFVILTMNIFGTKKCQRKNS